MEGDRSAAARLLDEAASRPEAVDMGVFAAAARRRLGQLLGGERGQTLMDQADDWMALGRSPPLPA
jgi:eukaryotic-like serine/threonine-protein kinase